MKITKRVLALALTAFLITCTLTVYPLAEGENKYTFIDGENITRATDTAVIYKGVASTGQTQWGHNVVVDASGTVTDIVEGGLPEGENLAVPENGAVISAAGTRVQWFKDNIKVGTKLYYDSYTQKLFICDNSGNFDPYFVKTVNVTGDGNYIISNLLADDSPLYTYDVAVDESGVVTARGSGVTAPEGGFTVSAATNGDRATLVMYAPLGAKCVVADGVATFTYDKTMLKRTAEAEIALSDSLAASAAAGFYFTDINAINQAIADAKTASSGNIDYKTLIDLIEVLEINVNRVSSDTESTELRGAFHTPAETDINAVRATVKAAKNAGLNTLYLRVSNGYGTFIPMPEGSKFKQDSVFGGFDVLKAYIDVCKEENIALGLSIDVYYNQYASIAAPDWMTEPNGETRGLADKYYSPANEEFKKYFTEYVEYIVANYNVSSIVFDYLRYPKFHESCDLGYDYITVQTFSESYGIPINEADAIKTELFNSPHWEKWVEFRRGLVTDMAKTLSDAVNAIRTDVTLLAAAGRDSVDHYYMQDSIGWIEEGIFDGICLTLYEGDSDENDSIDPLAYTDGFVTAKGEIFGAYTGKNSYFFVSLETASPISADDFANAVYESRSIGADGFIASSLNSFIAQKYGLSLENSALKGNAVSQFSDTVTAMKTVLEFAKTKINDHILPFGGCTEDTATQALAKINDALLLLDSGVLGHSEAQTLESDIAMIFASSNAKQAVLKEFEALTKLALLYKEESVIIPPDVSGGETSVPPENSEPDTDISEVSEEESKAVTDNGEKIDINIGNILIYVFVGLATVAATAAMIIGIRRKNKLPANHHMPKASMRENKESDKDE